MKRKLFTLILFFVLISSISYANLLQILFFSNSVLKPKKNVVVFFNAQKQDPKTKNFAVAARASLKINVSLVDINKLSDIPKYSLSYISKADYIIILSDETTFNSIGKKFILQKALSKRKPVITDKASDFSKGAFITIEGKTKQINQKVGTLLGIAIPEDVKAKKDVIIK